MNVLFVCVQNAGRSQIAEAFFQSATTGEHGVRSAGSAPAARVHPEVVAVMSEVDVDLEGRTPRGLDRSDVEWADLVVTMGCGDACPVLPGKSYIDWELRDPAGLPLDEVRAVRDEIEKRVNELVKSLHAKGEKVETSQKTG
jgi:arsenate reductase (thioredoxin)